MPDHDVQRPGQAALEEMVGAGEHHHRVMARGAPVQHIGQRREVVVLPMQQQGAIGQRLGFVVAAARDGADRQAHQRDRRGRRAGFQPARRARVDVGAEGEADQRQRQVGILPAQLRGDGQGVLGLADAVVVFAFGAVDAAEARAHGDPAGSA